MERCSAKKIFRKVNTKSFDDYHFRVKEKLISNIYTKNSYVINYIHNSPLDQFEIRDIFLIKLLNNFQLSFTNIGFYLIISSLIIIIVSYMATNNDKLIGNKWSTGLESLYATIQNIVVNQINSKQGQMYFPFIYTLFIFILVNNLVGMVPYSFAPTSHFILTFFLSFTIVLGTTILGFQKHKLKYFSLLVPAGCPLALLPLLVLIEFISYLARNISLGLRLAANIFRWE